MAEQAERAAYRDGFGAGFGDGFAAAAKRAQDDKQGDRQGGDKAAGDGAEKPGRSKGRGQAEGQGSGNNGPADKDQHGGKDEDEGEDNNKDKDAGKDKDGKPATPIYKRPLFVLGGIVLLLVALIAGVLFWRHARQHVSTDDAFVDGQASRIAAQAPGRVLKLYVADNQTVQPGDPLLDIDASDLDARLEQARAQLLTATSQVDQAQAQLDGVRANVGQAQAATRQAEAEAARAERDLQRFRSVDPDAVAGRQADSALSEARVARAKVDAARANTRAAEAQVKAALARVRAASADVATARANVTAAQLQRGYTHVVAPIGGRVTKRSVDIGNVVSVGQPLLAIVSSDLWVTANYKETQLTRMRVGQRVDVTIDAFPDATFSGHVDSIQRGTGAFFSMLPAENATGNYVKVVQRVPVKIVFDRPQDLSRYAIGPGMSAVPDVQLQ